MTALTRNQKLRPAHAWFEKCDWKPFAFQKKAWNAHLDGKSLLIHSATGTGKTLAAWVGPLLDGLANPIDSEFWTKVRGKGSSPPLMALWVTPLRALAGDTLFSLEQAIQGLFQPLPQ